ncbi:MAG: hypothetical protein PHG87_01480 [Candidatus Omnitrophica bacterium]|nr:hypothetical protein [Candidatus Omnitrophota bacterium]
MKKEKRIKNRTSVESILAEAGFYGLTEKDLANREKLDEVCIRLNADVQLKKKHQPLYFAQMSSKPVVGG